MNTYRQEGWIEFIASFAVFIRLIKECFIKPQLHLITFYYHLQYYALYNYNTEINIHSIVESSHISRACTIT